MACGMYVIASDTGGIPEILDDSCGALFRSNDEQHLLKKINEALCNDDVIREKGRAAEKKIIENFTLKKNCMEYSALYSEILQYDQWDISEPEKEISINCSDFFN